MNSIDAFKQSVTTLTVPTPLLWFGIILLVILLAYAAGITYLGCRNERTMRILSKENKRLRHLLYSTPYHERHEPPSP